MPVSGVYFVDASAMVVIATGDTVACILADNGNAVGPFATVGPVPNQTYETLPPVSRISMTAGDVPQVERADYTGNSNSAFYNGAIE